VLRLSGINSLVKELFEAGLELLLPEELFVSITINEAISGFNDLIEVTVDHLEGTEEDELILDLNKEITTSLGLEIKSGNKDRDHDEVINNLLDNVSDTILSSVALDRRSEADITFLKVNLDVEHSGIVVVSIVLDVDLISQVQHGGVDTIGNTLNDKRVQVVNIS
jgi:hypothetical protein